MPVQRTVQGVLADFGAGTSFGVAGFTWLAPVADALQIVATGVAIVAGIYAIRWHRVRIKIAQEKEREQSNR